MIDRSIFLSRQHAPRVFPCSVYYYVGRVICAITIYYVFIGFFGFFFQHIPLLHMHIDDFLQFRLFVLCSSPPPLSILPPFGCFSHSPRFVSNNLVIFSSHKYVALSPRVSSPHYFFRSHLNVIFIINLSAEIWIKFISPLLDTRTTLNRFEKLRP